MLDLTNYNPNGVGNPNNNVFGFPSTEENSKLVLLPIPWEVTVSYSAGTARAPEDMFTASLQVDIYDAEAPDAWKHGYYMEPVDPKILMKSDYLRKEAELFIDYISKGDKIEDNQFMLKTLSDVNTGSEMLNKWVYEKTRGLLNQDKLVGIVGGDHSVPLGYYKALAEKHDSFGILQIDAHCDLRKAYEGFNYSHASIMYNALAEVPQIERLVQIGIRDFGEDEWEYIRNSDYRVITYFDKEIKSRLYEGETWRSMAEEIISKLPSKVYISFDIDGLDPKLCPQTGTPVPGGFEVEQVYFLLGKILSTGRTVIGFDLCEVGINETDWNANVGARVLYKLCNLLMSSHIKSQRG